MSYGNRTLLYSPFVYLQLAGNAQDSSGNALHGFPVGSIAWASGIGDGQQAARFTQPDSYILVANNPGVSPRFNGASGALMVWFRKEATTLLSNRYVARVFGDAGNHVSVYWHHAEDQLTIEYNAGGTLKKGDFSIADNDYNWHFALAAWHKAEDWVRFQYDQQVVEDTGLGTWSATALSSTNSMIGAFAAGQGGWFGQIAHVGLFNAALPAWVAERLAVLPPAALTQPITDRALTDIQNRTSKAFWNVADWERVTGNTDLVSDGVYAYGGLPVALHTLTPPTVTTIPKASDINQMVENIERLRVAAALDMPALKHDYAPGLGAPAPDFHAANAWEAALEQLYDAIPRAYAYSVPCGAAAAGQPRWLQAGFRG